MKIDIDNQLKRVNKSRYWLAKQVGISHPTVKRLCDNNSGGIKFEIIENICVALDCTPNDIMILEK